MRQLFILFSGIIIFSGCATSSINVLEHKEPSKPFSKLLAIYVDGDFELRFLDSTTYDICIRSYFADSNNLELRDNAETVLSEKLSSDETVIVKSASLFDMYTNSYDDFTKQIDSLGIDGILLISRRNYTHTSHALPSVSSSPAPYVYNTITTSASAGGGSYKTPNVVFDCYLIKSKTYFPLWKAELDVKGRGYYNGKGSLRNSMAEQLAKNFVSGGYIVRKR